MFLYFENLYIFFCIFELLENMCHTTRAVRQTLKKERNLFLVFLKLFGRKCHTTRAAEQTQQK